MAKAIESVPRRDASPPRSCDGRSGIFVCDCRPRRRFCPRLQNFELRDRGEGAIQLSPFPVFSTGINPKNLFFSVAPTQVFSGTLDREGVPEPQAFTINADISLGAYMSTFATGPGRITVVPR